MLTKLRRSERCVLKTYFAPSELSRGRYCRVYKHYVPTGLSAVPNSYKVVQMADKDSIAGQNEPRDLDQEQARLAYSIIESLLEHTRVVSDLIALMAQTLDEDTTKALTQTPVWTAYLDSRRAMERTRADIEKFAEIMKELSEDQGTA